MLEGMSTQLSRTMGQSRSHAPLPSGLGEGDLGLLMAQAQQAFSHLPKEILELGEIFAEAGEEISLVGGPVRDAFLGLTPHDFDCTTSARPEKTEKLLAQWGNATWDIGREFGTIGGRRGKLVVEVTTYRTDSYEVGSRKPEVEYGDTLEGDLTRRDFTVNAMAMRLPQMALVDPHDGLGDLASGRLRTPVSALQSFDDDPLRIMRAARFSAQLGIDVDEDVMDAMESMAGRLEIVSAEALVSTVDEHHRHKDVYQHTLTVLDQAIDLETDADGPVPGPDFILRFAALMHDVGKPATRRFESNGTVSFHHHELVGAKLTRKRMKALRFDKATIDAVSELVALHLRFHGYGEAKWTDSAVRRYVADAGELLERLHRLTRADCTTRNKRKAAYLSAAYDDLEERIAALRAQEELDAIRPDLDGDQIMEILGLRPSKAVKMARDYLLDLRMEQGPLGEEAAREALLAWWASDEVREIAAEYQAQQERWEAKAAEKKARKRRSASEN